MGVGGSKHDVDINPAFEALLKNHQAGEDILSVGSGYGVTEKGLQKKYNVKITTIDPLVEKFKKPKDMELAKMPDYMYVKNYMEKNEKSDDVSLILDWPSPNDATYGVEAIEALNPRVILIRYASCGAAGSERLQSFLGSCGCPSYVSDEKNACNGKYTCVYSDQTVIGTGVGFDGKTIDVVVLTRK